MKLIDIKGQKFGKATVLYQGETRKNGGSNWVCLCDCGEKFVAIGSNLRNGSTASCGCVAKAWATHMGSNKGYITIRAEKMVKHGAKRRNKMTVEYRTWLGMKRRCYDKNFKDYPGWGGRGIGVCEKWRNDFSAFLADMGTRPNGCSIDRIDPNRDYSPENCRWATAAQQGGEHKRSNRQVTVDGVFFDSVAAACRYFGVATSVANMRIKSGIPMEVAVKETGRLKPRRSKESYLLKNKR
jgi:hypothetical protein